MKGFRAMVLVLGGVATLAFAACETAKDTTDEGGSGSEDALTTADTTTTGDTTASTDKGGGGTGDCETFCADAVSACPEDDTMETCLHSCETADKEPDTTALECAAAATDCTAIHACWPMLFN